MEKLPVVRFELIEFNHVRRARGKEAAKIRVMEDGENQGFIWMDAQDIKANIREFGICEAFKNALLLYGVQVPAKISETQQRVLQLLNKGLPAQLSRGSAVEIDGKRVCNLDTMRALVRLGYAKQITSPPMWMSTEIGRQISPQTDQEKL